MAPTTRPNADAAVKKAPARAATSKRPSHLLSALVLLTAVLYSVWVTRRLDVLRYISTGLFDWSSSTTTVPISAVSVVLKRLLASDIDNLPIDLMQRVPHADTIQVQHVRSWLSEQRLIRLRAICQSTRRRCDIKRKGPHGLTALHVAAMASDRDLDQYLRTLGATDILDNVGRFPRNISFSSFIENAKNAAKLRNDHLCDLPVVDFDGSEEAHRETARLVGEGEPVLLRGAMHVLAPELMQSTTVGSIVQNHGDVSVQVGSVPYAGYFNLTTTKMSLADFHSNHMGGGFGNKNKNENDYPMYVFAKDVGVTATGYTALERLVSDAFPTSLFVPPAETGGAAETHFFLGRARSGAPHHLHADAVNAAIIGTKRWFIYTPARALYSRLPVAQWVEHELPKLPDDEQPLQCVQKPGDVVYVPLDWGHAVLNEDDAFGVALEVLNRRDTLLDIAGRRPVVFQ